MQLAALFSHKPDMFEPRRISVKTVGYYHRDSEFQVTPDLLPRTLNPNKVYFEDPSHYPLKPINLNIKVPDYGAGELKMESLLEYIGLKGWPNDTPPQFVTNRQLLRTIAAPREDELLEVVGIRRKGVVYLLKVTSEASCYKNFGAVFERFWLNEVDDETVRKGVFLAEIPSENGPFSVMYSGEIDAIDKHGNHVEFKVFSGGLNYHFWTNRSSETYWQAVFGDVKTLVIGSRTGKFPNDWKTRPPLSRCLPENSAYKVEKLSPHLIPQKLHCFCKFDPTVKEWSISEGEARLTRFLDFVKSAAQRDGDAFLITNDNESEWTIEQNSDSEVIRDFQEAVRSCLNLH